MEHPCGDDVLWAKPEKNLFQISEYYNKQSIFKPFKEIILEVFKKCLKPEVQKYIKEICSDFTKYSAVKILYEFNTFDR